MVVVVVLRGWGGGEGAGKEVHLTLQKLENLRAHFALNIGTVSKN